MTSRRFRVAAVVVVAVVVSGTAGMLVLPGLIGGSGAGPAPRFVDETAAAGLVHRYDGGVTFAVGGGVAVFDCSGDGFPDVYLAGGEHPAALYRNESGVGGAVRFAGVADPVTDLDRVSGAYPLDLDGDGQVDLAVLRAGESVLLRGVGDCRFERWNEALRFDGFPGHTTAFSATWEADATLPTLALGHYLALGADGSPGFECADSGLVRPDPAATTYAATIPLAPGYCALSMLFSDWDRSGRRDLRVTNDRQYYRDGMDQLWRVAAGEPPRAYTAEEGWAEMRIWGMGIASRDLTGDGFPEVFLTSQGDNKLQTLASGSDAPTFRDIARRLGATVAQPFTGGDVLPSTAWHPEFDDVNNDGLVDLFVSKGNVSAQPGYATRDPSNLLLGQSDGTFVEAADRAGIVGFDRGRGASLVDLNLDGLLDLVVVNYGADAKVWRNVGAGSAEAPSPLGHWVGLRLEQPGPNRDAIGAWIETRLGASVTTREVTIGGGHVGGELGWIHVGLGSAEAIEVRVQWPDGETNGWLRVAADRFVVVERGATEAREWRPPAD